MNCRRCGRDLGTGLPSPCDECEPGKLRAEAKHWDNEADKCARQNPVMLRRVIQHCRARAVALRQQARFQELIDDGRDAA